MLTATLAAAVVTAAAARRGLRMRRPAHVRPIEHVRDLTTLVDEAAGQAASLLGVDATLVELWRADHPAEGVSISSGLGRAELAEHRPVLDTSDHKRTVVAEFRLGSEDDEDGRLAGALLMQLTAGSEVSGRVVVFWRRGGVRPDERSLNELETLVKALSAAAERREGLSILTHAPTRDQLTGLHNRRFFDEDLAREVDRTRRHRRRSALLLLDVHAFSELNERLGRESADAVLAELAGRLQATVRATESMSRISSDEFALVVLDGGSVAAVNLFERLRSALGSDLGLTSVPVDLCGGVAELGSEAPDDLLSRAYRALAAAKRSGAGRVVVAPSRT